MLLWELANTQTLIATISLKQQSSKETEVGRATQEDAAQSKKGDQSTSKQ